jgi:hypothetical protein
MPAIRRKQSRCSWRVSRILSAFSASANLAVRFSARRRDDHSSRPGIAGGLERPTRRLRTGRPQTPPYLALLRAGFCLPHPLRAARCALTAPFHPYPSTWPERALPRAEGLTRGGIFSVPLSFELPRPGITRHTALWSSDFPPPAIVSLSGQMADDGRPARCNGSLILAGRSRPILRVSRRSPAGCCIARASCRGCSAACR